MVKTLILTLLFCSKLFAENKIIKVEYKNDQIAQVKTALGIATIIQVPDIPNSVVVGDSEAFKVEYLDQAITIKPLHAGAKSNLYIYTDYRRYNVQLVSAAQTEANFIVYLEPSKGFKKKEKPIRVIEPHLTGIRWWNYDGKAKNNEIIISLNRVGISSNEVVLFEFNITANKEINLEPSSIFFKQNGRLVTIHNLFLSGVKVSPLNSIKGTIEVLKTDLVLNSKISFELQRKNITKLSIKEISSWQNLKQSL